MCATQLDGHLIQHVACARVRKRAERGGQRSFEPVGSVRPTEHERERPNHRGSLHDRKEKDPSRKRVSMERHREQDGLAHRFSKERDKEQDGLAQIFRKQTREKTPLVALYKRSQLAPISCSATLGNKTKTLACQLIVLSRTRQRDKRSHQRREQGPRALLTKRSPSGERGREINGLIDGLGTRTPSAAHQTIESAAESEIGPKRHIFR